MFNIIFKENTDMPLSPEHKQRSKQKILQSAAKLFTSLGYDNVSIDQIMRDARLTRGAFYAHFSSKSDLYKQSILDAALNSNLAQKKPDEVDNKDWLKKLLNGYLSLEHIEGNLPSCPLAFLATDVAIRDMEVRNTYTHIFKNMNKLIHKHAQTYTDCNETKILAVTAMMIGSVAVGRSLTDKKTTAKLLESCKSLAQTLLEVN